MIREQRNRDKLQKYYDIFMSKGQLDPNVHPWVAQSWQKSKDLGVNTRRIAPGSYLTTLEFQNLQEQHQQATECFTRFGLTIEDFIREYDLCIALLDSNCRVLKRFANPASRFIDRMEGTSLAIEHVGTMSCNIVREHQSPFWLFGPEVWLEEVHGIDSGSVPIIINGELTYIISLGVMEYGRIEQDMALALLFTLKASLEMNIEQLIKLKAQETILDATPFAVYHISNSDKVIYANKLGKERLENIHGYDSNNNLAPLRDIVLNYQHTPIAMGFQGVACYNRETTWITKEKTYEDITTVVPIYNRQDTNINSIVTVSMPIEDLRTLVAHASGYTAKYSLNSMVGEAKAFIQMKERAQRLAKNKNHILLQGEAGTGKQRLAHGIHMESNRKASPLISINCGGTTPEILEQEFFGAAIGDDSHPGKLELASQGTLFIDEIEKLPANIAKKLANALASKKTCRIGETLSRNIDVRIISATDTNLNRMVVKNQFDEKLFHILAKSIIRVPSLRNRREDIPLLAHNIVEELSHQHQLPEKEITPAGMEMLYGYDWPGNIKQLQSVLELAFFNTDEPIIDSTDINLMGNIKPDSSWKTEKDVFVRAWKSAGGNISRLANLLSVSRVTLYRYIKKYGLEK